MTREEAIDILDEILRLNLGLEQKGHPAIEAMKVARSALTPPTREQISQIKTCDLVTELKRREGVETHIAEPYQDVTVSVNGPAVVLVVID